MFLLSFHSFFLKLTGYLFYAWELPLWLSIAVNIFFSALLGLCLQCFFSPGSLLGRLFLNPWVSLEELMQDFWMNMRENTRRGTSVLRGTHRLSWEHLRNLVDMGSWGRALLTFLLKAELASAGTTWEFPEGIDCCESKPLFLPGILYTSYGVLHCIFPSSSLASHLMVICCLVCNGNSWEVVWLSPALCQCPQSCSVRLCGAVDVRHPLFSLNPMNVSVLREETMSSSKGRAEGGKQCDAGRVGGQRLWADSCHPQLVFAWQWASTPA